MYLNRVYNVLGIHTGRRIYFGMAKLRLKLPHDIVHSP